MFAAFNEFDQAVLAFSDVDDVSIGTVSEAEFGGAVFAETIGVDSQGDVLLQLEGAIDIQNPISAGEGSADVRLQALSLIHI